MFCGVCMDEPCSCAVLPDVAAPVSLDLAQLQTVLAAARTYSAADRKAVASGFRQASAALLAAAAELENQS